jgi:hypothetical protein
MRLKQWSCGRYRMSALEFAGIILWSNLKHGMYVCVLAGVYELVGNRGRVVVFWSLS